MIIIFGVTDHIDLGGHLQKLLRKEVPRELVEAAVLSLYKATMTARIELKDYWPRVVVVTGPGYAQLPLALQKVMAGMSLTQRATEFANMGGNTLVDENGAEHVWTRHACSPNFQRRLPACHCLKEQN